jgi:hypothetical protein
MLDTAAFIDRCAHERERMIEPSSEHTGSIGGGQFGAVPPEQLDSDLSLEGTHLLAYGGRRDPKLTGGPRKIAMTDTGRQDAQRFQTGQGFAHVSFKARLQIKVNNYRYEATVFRPTL